MVASGSSLHPLQTPFIFSYMRRGKAAKGETGVAAASNPGSGTNTTTTTTTTTTTDDSLHPYENSIKTISQVETVEGFWETYDFLKRPNDLPSTTDYHFFRGGETPIKPTWEDPSNAKGGKWIIRMPKGLASRYWEEIILALIGGQFVGVPEGEICGAVLSVRYSEDILGVWNRTATDRELIDKIRDAIKKVLQLPVHANMEYKPHQASLQDRSSFRNTQVWKPNKERVSSSMPESSGPPSRRSGSWTERDKSIPGNNIKSTGTRGSGDRGSWRTGNH